VALLALAALLLFTGCRTVPPAPSVNLNDPAWTVRQGQAVWTPERGAEGIAGELMLATQPDGSCWMQFSKPPFTIMTASHLANRWHIEFQQGSQRYGGAGEPPARLAWFQLANALSGQPTRAHWEFSHDADDGWLLKHSKRGEKLEGYFHP